jgi:hypothetical protein
VFKKLLYLILFFPVISFGQLTQNDTQIPELVVSGRSMALGNAFSARVDDSMSAFYNPAGLGTVRKFELRISDLYFDNDTDMISMINPDNIWGDLVGELSIDGTRSLMVQENKNLAYSRFNFIPNIVTRYFSIGYFYSQKSYMGIAESATPTFEWTYRQDQGGFLSFNFSLLGGVIKFGLTGLYMWRKETEGSSPANQVIEFDDNDFDRGQGYFGIAGFKFTYPMEWLPTLSAAYQNIANGTFSNYGAGPVSAYPTNLTVAASISPQVGRQTRLHIEADYVDALRNNSQMDDIDRLEVSMELEYDRINFLRVGWLDGYLSGGIGLNWPHLNINLSTYAVQATLAPGQVEEDRRYVISISYGI